MTMPIEIMVSYPGFTRREGKPNYYAMGWHIPPRFPPLGLVRRLPTEFVATACIRQASDNPSHKRTFGDTTRKVCSWR